uniref:Uncharacterized protein n=1 Tax=Ditylenchus dipsaci TaxID=166011 RepID=A0A915CXJ2_9BILA
MFTILTNEDVIEKYGEPNDISSMKKTITSRIKEALEFNKSNMSKDAKQLIIRLLNIDEESSCGKGDPKTAIKSVLNQTWFSLYPVDLNKYYKFKAQKKVEETIRNADVNSLDNPRQKSSSSQRNVSSELKMLKSVKQNELREVA